MMQRLSDIEIAKNAKVLNIEEIAKQLGIDPDNLENYGKYKAKISLDEFDRLKDAKNGKLVLVTSINPTPAGEGKSTVSIGLSMGLNKIGKRSCVALREPSLGPVFGVKGGAAGGGYSQVLPMEDINLHFTGDLHAITSANNLISAIIDNHIHQGNVLDIDTNEIVWNRVMDMNDRSLRDIVIAIGPKTNGVVREDHFMITVASEIMAILCLADGIEDLKNRISNIIVAYNRSSEPIRVSDLGIEGAATMLLKDAIKPNLVQTIENTPAIIHGGPFANIAHGCNSVMATKLALKTSEICVTEGGFGADLGAEKFIDIKCQMSGLYPDAVVIVATIKALKMHGGLAKDELEKEDVGALTAGFANLKRHIENMKKFSAPVIVAINQFYSDTENEINKLRELVSDLGVKIELCTCFENGSDGAIDLANTLVKTLEEEKSSVNFLYDLNLSIEEKINKIAKEIYGASAVTFSAKAKKEIKKLEKLNLDKMPICVAKTQFSFSDDKNKLAAPTDFKINIQNVRVSAGAGFIVMETSNIMIMPGLSKSPAALKMDIDAAGNIKGLF